MRFLLLPLLSFFVVFSAPGNHLSPQISSLYAYADGSSRAEKNTHRTSGAITFAHAASARYNTAETIAMDAPIAMNDNATVEEDESTTIDILANDDANGSVVLPATVAISNENGGSFNANILTGVVTFTPTLNFNGMATANYTVGSLLSGTSGEATISVEVTPVNDQPSAGDDNAATPENTAVTINVLANDNDVEGLDPASISFGTQTGGTFSANSAGEVLFTPTTGFSGLATTTYSVQDYESATSNAASISVTVTEVNNAPTANNDIASVNEDGSVNIDVLANDTDPDGNISTATIVVTGGTNGSFVATASGVSYTPTANFNGTATANYTVSDTDGAVSNTATITVTVNPDNDAPVAGDDTGSTSENTSTQIQVLLNDNDIDDGIAPSTIVFGTQTGGTFSADAAGLVTFAPTTGFSGSATATYTVKDVTGASSNSATITISVTAVNDVPTAVNDAVSVAEDTPVVIDVLANDTDPEGNIDPSTVVVSGGTNGTYSVNATTGAVTYTPTSNYHGPATATYTVSDGSGTSNSATITITVTSVNDPPAAVNDAATTNENVAVSIDVLDNDTDVEGIDVTQVVVTGATNGTFVPNPVTGQVLFTPTAGFSGSATASYTFKDTDGATSNSATITVTVTPVNSAPVAADDGSNTVGEDGGTITINILQNDADGDGSLDPASVALGTATGGTFSVNTTTGVVSFTPSPNYNGVASTTYTVKDNDGAQSNTATITVNVTAVNDAPTANNDAATTNEDTPVNITVLSNDSDADGTVDVATVSVTGGTGGSFSANATTGVVSFTPTANFSGSATATYTVRDNSGAVSNSATITVTVTPVNDPPVANNDGGTTNEDTPLTLNLISNDTDPDGTIAQSTITIANPSGGTFTATATGVNFAPVANFAGTATAFYTVEDNGGAVSGQALITITVVAVNDPPVANNNAASTNEDVPVNVNVVANDTDIDGSINPATVVIGTSSGGTFVPNSSGVVAFTPNTDFSGTATAAYTVKDNGGATSNTATITITVSSVVDAPIAADDAATTSEDVAVNINILANDNDTDGTISPASVIINTGAVGGTFTANASGVVTFTPAANFHGVAIATYTVKDNNAKTSNQATISVTVTPVNDPPSFTAIDDQTVLQNAGQQFIQVTNISPGPLENETLLVTISSGNTALIPTPAVTYDPASKTATIAYTPQQDQTGTADITLRVVDTGPNEYTQTFTINVIELKITSEPVTVAVAEELYEYNITASDVEGTYTLTAAEKPSWATFAVTGDATATLSGTPPAGAPANTVVRIQLKDGETVLDEQQFTLVVNRRPVISSFEWQISEDQIVPFEPSRFTAVYSDPDGHPLTFIRFDHLPEHGILKLNTVPINVGEEIPFSSVSIITYEPTVDYVGLDTLYWKASDGFNYSLANTYINFVIAASNDAPVITVLETDTLAFEVGSEVAQFFTTSFEATDSDDDSLASAEVGFRRPAFSPLNDMLEFTNTTNITGSYDRQIGILTLTGKAPVQEYIDAIRSIKYNFINLEDLNFVNRTLYITLSDGKQFSDSKNRIIGLIYNFEDLDIPTAFTPNGDDANELWQIKTQQGTVPVQYTDAEIRIFNKRGQMVFESKGFEKAWDGTWNGQSLPVDTYYYTVDLKYNRITYKGAVMILR